LNGDPLDDIEIILKILSYQIGSKNVLAIDEIDQILHLLQERVL
jgi:hypothetical protein